jgi:hypothetical protein
VVVKTARRDSEGTTSGTLADAPLVLVVELLLEAGSQLGDLRFGVQLGA